MYLLIPVVDNNNGRKTIAKGFAFTDYACLYNTENAEISWLGLNELKVYSGNIIEEFKRRHIRFIITSEMKPVALGLFVENDIIVYQAEGKNLDKNIRLFNEDRLFLLNPYLALMKVSCQSTCGGCVSTCKN